MTGVAGVHLIAQCCPVGWCVMHVVCMLCCGAMSMLVWYTCS